mmetsp:Transcript_30797/g.64637  ORF Transcript_30797/g.64637 Transcript_30797/m.64637 type:complete len:225 (-) Transcript_30797:474-1148(-)
MPPRHDPLAAAGRTVRGSGLQVCLEPRQVLSRRTKASRGKKLEVRIPGALLWSVLPVCLRVDRDEVRGAEVERVPHVRRAAAGLERHRPSCVERGEVGQWQPPGTGARDASGRVALGFVVARGDHVGHLGRNWLQPLHIPVVCRLIRERRHFVREGVVSVPNVADVPDAVDGATVDQLAESVVCVAGAPVCLERVPVLYFHGSHRAVQVPHVAEYAQREGRRLG